MSPQQQDLLREVPRVILLMDGDEAGRKAAHRIHARLSDAVVVDLPEGLDPDDLGDQDLAKLKRHLL
jgi:DNA primase